MRVRPLVGVTTYHREIEERPRFYLPSAYVDAVRVGGGIPVLLTPGEERPAELLESLDALVFSGGGDLDPVHFGGDEHPHSYFICEERDAFELQLMRAALERETPVLAICRGTQVVNVALGGSLHSHLEDVVGDAIVHRESQTCHSYHPVKLDPDSRLATLMGATELAEVASWHHQAVDRLGEGLRAVAWASDGTVEALELPEAPQLLAIQWHPELQIELGSLQRRLFEAIVRMARERC
jgi:putative glutamine amidotransferase